MGSTTSTIEPEQDPFSSLSPDNDVIDQVRKMKLQPVMPPPPPPASPVSVMSPSRWSFTSSGSSSGGSGSKKKRLSWSKLRNRTSSRELIQQIRSTSLISTTYPKRIHTKDWDTKPPCTVIVTIYTASSHDNLFRAVQQQSPSPNHSVALFEMDHPTIPTFLEYLQLRRSQISSIELSQLFEENQLQAFTELLDAIELVDPNSVVFNFESCDHYCTETGFHCQQYFNQSSSQKTKHEEKAVVPLIRFLIEDGYMVMVADFSLKALIADWDPDYLGPNPFHIVGTCHDSMTLTYDSKKLLQCPSSQLQAIGRLSDGRLVNTAEVNCQRDTILCTLKPEDDYAMRGNTFYTMDVLTIVTKVDNRSVRPPFVRSEEWLDSSSCSSSNTTSPELPDGVVRPKARRRVTVPLATRGSGATTTTAVGQTHKLPPHRLLRVGTGNNAGYLSHSILRYKSGGSLLVSTSHWIELYSIGSMNEQCILQEIEKHYDNNYCKDIERELLRVGHNNSDKQRMLQHNAILLIQSSSPAMYTIRR